jgi:hypothetical protein
MKHLSVAYNTQFPRKVPVTTAVITWRMRMFLECTGLEPGLVRFVLLV